MRLPLRWLRDYLPIDESPSEIASRLDSAGFEVESVSTFGEGCRGLVVARVEGWESHPNADRLRLCKILYGTGDAVDVVCGASNFDVGDYVAFAPPGSEIARGVRVEAKTVRGIQSYGMICSESELGVGSDSEGILVIADRSSGPDLGLEVGTPLEEVLGLGDSVIEVDITPNRPDAMSVLGLARELSASSGMEFVLPDIKLNESDRPARDKVSVVIEEESRCPRYIARYIFDVRVGPSPLWMALRLREAGARPINNVVDVTNFVLFEVGHPLHAFDYSTVSQGRIVVRLARAGERIATLDGDEHSLDSDDLVIADSERPLAIAGVVGGEGSGISASTTEVLLESAYFEPAGILRTAKRHGIRTESSARFERGCDPEGAEWASKRAACLIQQVCEATVARGAVDVYPRPINPARVQLRAQKTNRLLGTEIPIERQAELLSSIGLRIIGRSETALDVEVPTFRRDIFREVDLIEEVGRLYGYDNVKKTLPASGARIGRLDRTQRIRRRISQLVIGCGFTAVKNFSMLSLDKLPVAMRSATTSLANPLRVEESTLRPTLIPGLMESAARNLARRRQDLRLFEIGTVFGPPDDDGLPSEHLSLGGIVVLPDTRLTGARNGITDTVEAPEFFGAKAVLDAVFEAGRVDGVEFVPDTLDGFHPGRCAGVLTDGERIGFVAEVLPEFATAYRIEASTAVFEVDLDRICDLFSETVPYKQFSRFPPVYFDLAFVVANDTPAAVVAEAVIEGGGQLVERAEILDLYRSPKLGEGKKSVTVTVTLSALDRTLTDEEAGEVREAIIQHVGERLGAELRSS